MLCELLTCEHEEGWRQLVPHKSSQDTYTFSVHDWGCVRDVVISHEQTERTMTLLD